MNEGTASDEPDFVEGLSRVLSGIRAHLSSNVMSATMGHLLVTQGSRFSFSHSFSNLLLTQLQDLINEKEVRCRFKKKQAKTEKKLGGLTALLMTTGGDHLNLRKCVHMK